MTAQVKATALLAMCASKLERCEISTRGFTIIANSLGPDVAAWAYADAGEGEGLRAGSRAASLLHEHGERTWATVIAGPTGCGKTIAAARYVADRGGVLIYAPTADRWPYAATAQIDAIVGARWLLIDDLGDEDSKRALGQFRGVITERGHKGLSTIITTTLLGTAERDSTYWPETFHYRYGDHTWSRLAPHFHPIGRQKDLRGGPEPRTRGLERARRIATAGAALRPVAARGVDGPEAEAKLEAFAELAGIDLDGRTFLDAVEVETARRAELADLARVATERLAPAPADVTAPDLDSLAWLDSMEIKL